MINERQQKHRSQSNVQAKQLRLPSTFGEKNSLLPAPEATLPAWGFRLALSCCAIQPVHLPGRKGALSQEKSGEVLKKNTL